MIMVDRVRRNTAEDPLCSCPNNPSVHNPFHFDTHHGKRNSTRFPGLYHLEHERYRVIFPSSDPDKRLQRHTVAVSHPPQSVWESCGTYSCMCNTLVHTYCVSRIAGTSECITSQHGFCYTKSTAKPVDWITRNVAYSRVARHGKADSVANRIICGG